MGWRRLAGRLPMRWPPCYESWQSKGAALAAAVHRAANECLNEGILTEFFNEYWNEVEEMFSLMYDEQEAIKVAKEETIETILEIVRAYREGKSISEIAAQHDIQADKIEKIIAEIFP